MRLQSRDRVIVGLRAENAALAVDLEVLEMLRRPRELGAVAIRHFDHPFGGERRVQQDGRDRGGEQADAHRSSPWWKRRW